MCLPASVRLHKQIKEVEMNIVQEVKIMILETMAKAAELPDRFVPVMEALHLAYTIIRKEQAKDE